MDKGKYIENTLETWEEFLDHLKTIKYFRDSLVGHDHNYVSALIYRGQANSKWNLDTTLERFRGENRYEIRKYYKKIHEASYEIEAFTREKWNLPSGDSFHNFKELEVFSPHKILFDPKYDLATYYVYLRHHGFPSPLLDWTRSPFIAAYFGFFEQPHESEYISIYIFLEFMGKGMRMRGSAPTMHTLGPSIKSHERHFLQQCEYTFCLEKKSEEEPFFVNHGRAFPQPAPFQNNLWKFNIPSSERMKVLHFLDSANINTFSLFQSVEGLMSTAATRHFFLDT